MSSAAQTAYARLQRKVLMEQARLEKVLKELAAQKKALEAATGRAGTFVRNKYLSDPLIIRLLGKHGGLKPPNAARLALALGKKYVHPTMTVARNMKTRNNANTANIKRRYNTWYNSLTPNQKKQSARNYNRELNGSAWYNLNIIRNMNVTNTRYQAKRFTRIPLWFATKSSAPHVKNLRNAIWKRNGIPENWEPRDNRYNAYQAFRNLKRTRGKTYNMNNYKN
jgi:hypothetical protein